MTSTTCRKLTRAVGLSLAGVLATAALGGCAFDSFRFYEVTRAATDKCDILPSGEFCVEDEQLPAPTFEIWSIERRGDEVRVIVDEEVWIADPRVSETPDRATSSKVEVATVDPGPCTTTIERSFDLTAAQNDAGTDLATGADLPELTGTLSERTVLDGPEDCGETPRGVRTVATLIGNVAGAP